MTKDDRPDGSALSEGLGAWMPTAERLPAPDTDVLALVVFGATVRMTVAGYFQAWRDGPWGWYSFEQPEREIEVTHWQPLPKLPRDIPGICGAGLLQAPNVGAKLTAPGGSA
jgi:hypothetical protein